MKLFLSYYFNVIRNPRTAFNKILIEPKRLLFGFYAGLTLIFLYTLTITGNVVAGVSPILPPFLKISPADYYFHEIFFQAPVYLSGWILSSGIAYLLSKTFQGKGSFEDMLSVLGFSMNIPWLITWLIDSIIMLLYLSKTLTYGEWKEMVTRPGIWMILNALYPLISLVWSFILINIAISRIQKLKLWHSVLITITIVLINQIFMTVFIR